jgi:hypothetical protein
LRYLEGLARKIFAYIEIWLKMGIIAPKLIPLIEEGLQGDGTLAQEDCFWME